jgi:GH15 family glucan-1,4-alpha-glucosidase
VVAGAARRHRRRGHQPRLRRRQRRRHPQLRLQGPGRRRAGPAALGVEPLDSPRVRGTIDAIHRELCASGPLLYRYPPGKDGLPGTEGAFLPCSFWLVQALAKTGRREEATELLDELVALASPLGLYAEEVDPGSRRHLGNYPQALTHAALVQAALAIRNAGPADAREGESWEA